MSSGCCHLSHSDEHRVAAFNLASDYQLTLVRKKETNVNSTNSILHTEQVANTKRAVTNKRVAALNVTSEQHLTLHRGMIIRVSWTTIQDVQTRKDEEQKALADKRFARFDALRRSGRSAVASSGEKTGS